MLCSNSARQKKSLSVWGGYMHGHCLYPEVRQLPLLTSWVLDKPLSVWPCCDSCGSFILTTLANCPGDLGHIPKVSSLAHKAPQTCTEKLWTSPQWSARLHFKSKVSGTQHQTLVPKAEAAADSSLFYFQTTPR